jgi:hypothetical protein
MQRSHHGIHRNLGIWDGTQENVYCRFEPRLVRPPMRLTPYVAAIGFMFALLILSAPHASAQVMGGGGMIFGHVYGFDMWDGLVPLVWVTVTATNQNYQFQASTGGQGTFEMYVPVGTYNLTVDAPGYSTYPLNVSVSDGGSSAATFYFEQSHVPIPEFPTQALTLIIAMVLAVTLLSRKRRQKPAN